MSSGRNSILLWLKSKNFNYWFDLNFERGGSVKLLNLRINSKRLRLIAREGFLLKVVVLLFSSQLPRDLPKASLQD
jgi:hypothetical protein